MSSAETREAILQAAEELFGASGVNGISLRAVLDQAGVNQALAHYHFGTRNQLIKALITRSTEPVNQARLAALAVLEEQDLIRPGKTRLVLQALIVPVFTAQCCGGNWIRLITSVFVSGDPELVGFYSEQFAEVYARFHSALRVCLPELSHEQLTSRLAYVIGAITYPLLARSGNALPGVQTRQLDGIQVVQELLVFCTAGLEAN